MADRPFHHRCSPRPPAGAERFSLPWVRLRSGSGHPLLYQRMIAEADPKARAGDIVAVFDKNDAFFGQGFYHNHSQLALRILTHGEEPVDEDFFRERLRRAIEWRERLITPELQTDAYRLVHAEGDGLSGLIAERYADVAAIEVFSAGVFRRIEMFKALLGELTGLHRFVVRADEHIQRIEQFNIPPDSGTDSPRTVTVRESGLRFRVDLQAGHKTGFFCDQRDNRRRLAGLCRGAEMLDVCCYSGGFSIYAMKLGGAASVTGVDLDEEAVEMARKNANLNDAKISFVHADGFGYLRQMQTNGRRFDVVVLDPPKFVPRRDDLEEGNRKYLDLNTLGMSVVKPGGVLLTCSCSGLVSRDDFLGLVKAAANRLRRPVQIVDQTGAGPDHPVMANCLESGYLKAIWARVF